MSMTELLERRTMLAVSPDPDVSIKLSKTGALTVVGTVSAEMITVASIGAKGTRVAVEVKSADHLTSRIFSRGDVKRLNVHSANGNDRIVVSLDVSGRTDLWGGRGDDTIITHSVRTRLFGEAGNDLLVSDPVVTTYTNYHADGIIPIVHVIHRSRNFLFGADGEDVFRSRGGDDTIGGGGLADEKDRFEPINAVEYTNNSDLPEVPFITDVSFWPSRVTLGAIDSLAPVASPDNREIVVWYNEFQ
jgi:hypothetical protein